MKYLEVFTFPDEDKETDFTWDIKETCYDTYYPFGVLSKNRFERIDFEDITILYGGNGSGKSTALNLIANKINAQRDTLYNKSNFYEDYLELCKAKFCNKFFFESRIITSDDVFDYMLTIRNMNEAIDDNRYKVMDEFGDIAVGLQNNPDEYRLKSLDDYDKLKKVNLVRKRNLSKYVRNYSPNNMKEQSNGESAFMYFTNKINENSLYILDEPENSLSPEKQLELLKFIQDSARFFNCQFIISTHSPIMLSLRGAKIYDLDEYPVNLKKWYELKNVRILRDFFEEYREEFE